jgi:hypothetical protein
MINNKVFSSKTLLNASVEESSSRTSQNSTVRPFITVLRYMLMLIINNISPIFGNETLIDEIEDLSNELNQIHIDKSLVFKHRYINNLFSERKKSLLGRSDKVKL